MNEKLRQLALQHDFESPKHEKLRIEFGLDCVARVLAHITDTDALAAFEKGRRYVTGQCTEEQFKTAVESTLRIARSKPGTSGLDGSGNAAVSAMNALAKAMSGNALDAADYAAYTSVYAYSSHAVTDPAAYRSEHQWQMEHLRSLL